jgi:hypothetical protein
VTMLILHTSAKSLSRTVLSPFNYSRETASSGWRRGGGSARSVEFRLRISYIPGMVSPPSSPLDRGISCIPGDPSRRRLAFLSSPTILRLRLLE